jgi:membrane protease YdiL (CAAX protease family)
MGAGLLTLAVAWAAAFSSMRLVMDAGLRLRVQGWLAGRGGNFNPESSVHLVAVVLMLAIIVYMAITFASVGGVSGMAEDLAQNGLEPSEFIFQGVLEVVVALLGVGLAIRRGWPEAAQRLGLRLPTRQDIIWGAGVGLVCYIVSRIVIFILLAVASPEWIEEQFAASDQLAASFTTLPLAFLLAISAGVGEEIWVRGSLQPVFGLLVSSIFFTILHLQVAFTPGTLVILGVSLAFGWLRKRYSTTAAIIAHFMYDFITLALVALFTGMGGC